MSDSVKLRFEHGIWWMIFSHIFLVGVIVFGYLSYCNPSSYLCPMLTWICPWLLLGCFYSSINCFKKAIEISKAEKL